MKSVICEGASIAKAVEKAWIKSGRPSEFSVKILELPEFGFLGFVKKSAKIAIFFGFDGKSKLPGASFITRTGSARAVESSRYSSRDLRSSSFKVTQKASFKTSSLEDKVSDLVRAWIEDVLRDMGIGEVKFSTEFSNSCVRVKFSQKFLHDRVDEKRLFSSFACLLAEVLKRNFELDQRDLKIIITS